MKGQIRHFYSASSLISNGQRVGSSLSGMQTCVIYYRIDASGYPITTFVEINSNALQSFSQNLETWLFADSYKECNSINRSLVILIHGHLDPQTTSGSIIIKSDESGSKTVKALNLSESSSNAAGAQWEVFDKLSHEFPSSSFTNVTRESKYSLRVIEYTKGSQSDSFDASLNFEEKISPTEEEHVDVSSGLSTGAIIEIERN
ncbi:MAG: hypothetical protein EZS28_011651 [Streblomastix strix]|uniref:Uncharacterized protein n=1 Tax=Streblomastix strix TaxID=222440 RepID=A0A5J4WDS9_9EUKA|nr:MAG: hypothetical protein EZS28_011651 [Streblomastix strix]